MSGTLVGNLYKYIFFAGLCAALQAKAQEIPPEVVDAYEPDTLYAVRNAIKFDPVQVVFGDFKLYYERILSNRWSAEGGIGFTRRNYAAGWFDYDLDNLGAHIDIETGGSYSLALRYYLRKDPELNGPYLSLSYGYREYRKKYRTLDDAGNLTGEALTDRRTFSTLALLIGVQPLSYSGNVFVDVQTGPALRFVDFQQVRAPDDLHPQKHHYHHIDRMNFGWEVGVRIGFGF